MAPKTATEIQVEEDNKKENWPAWIKQIELLAQSQDPIQKVTTDWMKAVEERCKHEHLDKCLGEKAVCLLQLVCQTHEFDVEFGQTLYKIRRFLNSAKGVVVWPKIGEL